MEYADKLTFIKEVCFVLEKMDDLASCSLFYVASILGSKWKPFIVWYLSVAPHKRLRYGELKRNIPYNISHKMFSQHLGELEETGIIKRVVVDEKPLRVEYLLTKKGISFANVLYFIRDWGAVYGDFAPEALLRTKGIINDGVMMYGGRDDESHQNVGECITWQFDSPIVAAGNATSKGSA